MAQPVAPGLPDPTDAEVCGDQAHHRGLAVEPGRHRREFTTDLVRRKQIEYTALDGALFAHGHLRRFGVCLWVQWLVPNSIAETAGAWLRK